LYWYQPFNEGIYPLFICARLGRFIAKVERHTYLQPSKLLHRIGLPKLCYSYVEYGGRDRA